MQPWTHCLNQKENERPSSPSFLPASLCTTIIAELLTSSFDGSMRHDIRANNQLLNLTNFAVLDEGLRSGGRSPSVQRPVKPSFQNLSEGTDACGPMSRRYVVRVLKLYAKKLLHLTYARRHRRALYTLPSFLAQHSCMATE